MFSRHTRHHATAFVLALLVTAGMLGAVDSLATHTADAELIAAAQPALALQCPARV